MSKVIKEITNIEKGNGNTNRLKVSVSEYNKVKYLDLREWFVEEGSDELKPTKRGVTLKLKVFEELLAALVKSKSEICQLLSKPE